MEVTVNKRTAATKCVRWTCPIAARADNHGNDTSFVPAQGFILESDYEGDTGHPRVGNVQPGSISADVLVKGDIILEINGTEVTNHNQAASRGGGSAEHTRNIP